MPFATLKRAAFLSFIMTATAFAQIPALDVERFLPVHSERLRVGAFEAQRRSTGVSRPFFLIGTDNTSLTWLESNRERLLALQALGLIVEAPNAAAYRRVAAAAEGLLVRPVNADSLAEALRIQHYPVLVTADGIFP
jgi:integrating conjugative element protein (TIGR03765 family)